MKTTVKQGERAEDIVPREVLAQSIVKISEAATALRKSGLNRKAVIVLVAHSSGVPQREIKAVLDSLETLKQDYCV